ncbi:MAG: hypothetical protein ACYSSN_11965 [Planctomycetota bacterium]|jgi:hypothetical protein
MCRRLIYFISFVLLLSFTLKGTAFGGEWIIFNEELPPGADLALRADSQFVVSDSNPYQGANHLKRDFATWGDWAWITGIMNLNLDLSGIDFDTAYIEFYIDGGMNAIGYLELRLAGPAWDPDFQTTSVSVDDQPGYELFKVMLKDFTRTGGGAGPTNLDEFTGGTGMIDRVSWGFGATGDLFVDEVRILDGAGGVAAIASNPSPADGAYQEDTWVNLSWKPGDLAVSHDVYISDNFDDVDAGAESAFVGNQSDIFLVAGFPGFPFPDGLVPGTTYYWRIDEVNDTDPNSPWKGDVWSFMVPPKTAYLPVPADAAEAVAVNASLTWTPGFGAKLHTVYFGDIFEDVSNAAGASPQGTATFRPSSLKMAKTYYWRIDEFDAFGTYKGDVWSFTTEGAVTALDPVNGAVDVSQTPVLTWAPGQGASHEVYFGTDAGSLELKGTGNLGSESYEPGQLEWNTTYYWRIDEANNTNADSPWTGPLWSFTTANFLIIDDMESYNDLDEAEPGSNRIYLAWMDGYDNPAINGSIVGHANAPFAEQTIVHSGYQSLPMSYDNGVGKSEATLTLTSNNDWTVNGVDTLTIWFRGASGNAAETLYVALNRSARVDHDDPDAATGTRWTEWNIPLQAFADQGVNLANVNSITLGLGSVTGGTGIMYFDDIRLYAPAP